MGGGGESNAPRAGCNTPLTGFLSPLVTFGISFSSRDFSTFHKE